MIQWINDVSQCIFPGEHGSPLNHFSSRMINCELLNLDLEFHCTHVSVWVEIAIEMIAFRLRGLIRFKV